jgi:hypothetical protein
MVATEAVTGSLQSSSLTHTNSSRGRHSNVELYYHHFYFMKASLFFLSNLKFPPSAPLQRKPCSHRLPSHTRQRHTGGDAHKIAGGDEDADPPVRLVAHVEVAAALQAVPHFVVRVNVLLVEHLDLLLVAFGQRGPDEGEDDGKGLKNIHSIWEKRTSLKNQAK